MNKKKISLTLALVISIMANGCATTGATNVATFGNEYYRENVSKSKNYNELKEYLLKNNMKLGTIAAMSYSTVGGLANIGIDGQRRSFFTAENNVWLKSIMSNLVLSELSGLLLDVAGYTLIFCGDYNHASIGDNGSFGKVEYTYFLSNMTEEQRQISFKQPTLSDCGYDSYLGDIFYKKKIQVSSSPASAKLSIVRKNENIPTTSLDTASLVLKDMAEQAMTGMLTDAEMLQALKDYRLTGSKKIAVEQPSKTTVTEPITAPQPSTNQSVNLDSFKTQCKELGFKVGTADYGNCVLQLMK